MNIVRLLEDIIVIYIIYKIIFSFIIPVYTTTKQVKTKVNEMQQKMYQQQREQQQTQEKQQYAKQQRTERARVADDDYIDYEEVK